MATLIRVHDTFECVLCGDSRADVISDFGLLALPNDFRRADEDAALVRHAPLRLVLCQGCRLPQVGDQVAREELFRDRPYLWSSSTSAATRRHAGVLAAEIRAVRGTDAFVVEIASNDGLVQGALRAAGIRSLGVEPSSAAAAAIADGHDVVTRFFDAESAADIVRERGQADVVLARNVIGHSERLASLLDGVRDLLGEDGLFIVEVPYAKLLRDELQYDQIMHEHVSYWTAGTLLAALDRIGLAAWTTRFVGLNGGSLLVVAGRGGRSGDGRLELLADLELASEVDRPRGWARFHEDSLRHAELLHEAIVSHRAAGRTVAAYGAAAKTMQLLQHAGVAYGDLACIADANPLKQGMIAPVAGLPVVSPEDLVAANPDVVLIGPSNLASEIEATLVDRLGYRGAILLPFPVPSERARLAAALAG